MPADAACSYDELPYTDRCFPTTHPNHLATVARLHGLPAPPVPTGRVLELGCAQGGNLLPMAMGLPDGQFVGIDLSERQIAAAREMAAALDLNNVDFQTRNIADIGSDLGTFDFLVCHGVYSWVPREIQRKILEICGTNLTAGGVAYVSYNTYPGWHARGLVREILTYHARSRGGAIARVQSARDFLDDLVQVLPDPQGSYARILRTEAEYLRRAGDDYVFHEHLEETNLPCYFHEFAAAAAEAGLVPFAEAQDAGADDLPAPTIEAVDAWSDHPVARQQYLDFVTNRTFHRTILCRESARPRTETVTSAVETLRIRAAAWPLSETPELRSGTVESFRGETGAALETAHPVVKAALVALCEAWPAAVHYAPLRQRVQAVLPDVSEDSLELLPRALVRGFRSGLVELSAHPAPFHGEAIERPSASRLARLQVAAGREHVTNLQHRTVKLRAFDRALLTLLDGRHDRAALIHGLAAMAASGAVAIEGEHGPIRDPALVRGLIAGELEPSLIRITRHALLELND